MDHNRELPGDQCSCDCGGLDLHGTACSVEISEVTATCEFGQCGDGELVDAAADVALAIEGGDAFDQVLAAVMRSFAGELQGVTRVVVSEQTPDGPITYLDKSVDGDATPPTMAEIVG
ncbi:hypothetical protein [Lacipirellula sp.]|uniref:hypothetical protein n=1 Tax=Lacipirellula sp. TaxID=2691419 RepID=UPI003D14CEB2